MTQQTLIYPQTRYKNKITNQSIIKLTDNFIITS